MHEIQIQTYSLYRRFEENQSDLWPRKVIFFIIILFSIFYKRLNLTEEAIEALYKLCEGDMRKIVNMLQVTYKIIKSFSIYIDYLVNSYFPCERLQR